MGQTRFRNTPDGLVTLATGVLRIMEVRETDAAKRSRSVASPRERLRRMSSAGRTRRASTARRTSRAGLTGSTAQAPRRVSLVERSVSRSSAWIPTKCSIARDTADHDSRFLVMEGRDVPINLRAATVVQPSVEPEARGLGFDLHCDGQTLHFLPFHDEATLAFAARLMGSAGDASSRVRAVMMTGELWKRRPEKRTRRGSISALVLGLTKSRGSSVERDRRYWQRRICTVVVDASNGHRMLVYTDREDKDPIDLFHAEDAVEPSTTPGSEAGDGSFDLIVAGRTFSFASTMGDEKSRRLAQAVRAYASTCAQVNMVVDGVIHLPVCLVAHTDFTPQSPDELDLVAGSKYIATRLITEGCNRGEEWWSGEAIPTEAGGGGGGAIVDEMQPTTSKRKSLQKLSVSSVEVSTSKRKSLQKLSVSNVERFDDKDSRHTARPSLRGGGGGKPQQRRAGMFPCSFVNIASEPEDADLVAAWTAGAFEDVTFAVTDTQSKEAQLKAAVNEALQAELQELRDGMAYLRTTTAQKMAEQRAKTVEARAAADVAEQEKAELKRDAAAAVAAASAEAAKKLVPSPSKFSFASSIMSAVGSLSSTERYAQRASAAPPAPAPASKQVEVEKEVPEPTPAAVVETMPAPVSEPVPEPEPVVRRPSPAATLLGGEKKKKKSAFGAVLGLVKGKVKKKVKKKVVPKKVRTDAELKELRKSFNEYDADGSGSVDVEELQQVMISVGIKVSNEELEMAVAEVDEDGNGTLDFDEFVDVMDGLLHEGKASALAELFRRRSLKHVELPLDGVLKKSAAANADAGASAYANILGKMRKKNKSSSSMLERLQAAAKSPATSGEPSTNSAAGGMLSKLRAVRRKSMAHMNLNKGGGSDLGAVEEESAAALEQKKKTKKKWKKMAHTSIGKSDNLAQSLLDKVRGDKKKKKKKAKTPPAEASPEVAATTAIKAAPEAASGAAPNAAPTPAPEVAPETVPEASPVTALGAASTTPALLSFDSSSIPATTSSGVKDGTSASPGSPTSPKGRREGFNAAPARRSSLVLKHSTMNMSSVEQMKEWRACFDEYDADGSGTIDVEELSDVIQGVGIEVTEAALQAALDEVDTDGSGELDWNEFVAMMKELEMGGKASALAELVNKVRERKARGAVIGDRISADDAKSLVNSNRADSSGEASAPERVLIVNALSSCYAASGVVPGTIEFVANKMSRAEFAAGTNIFSAGGDADICYVIVEGSVDVVNKESGATSLVSVGETLGDSALALPCEREATASAVAGGRVVAYSIDRTTFKLSVGGFAALRSDKAAAALQNVAALRDALKPEQVIQLVPLVEFVTLAAGESHTLAANSMCYIISGTVNVGGSPAAESTSVGVEACMGSTEADASVATAESVPAELMLLTRTAIAPVLGNLAELAATNSATAGEAASEDPAQSDDSAADRIVIHDATDIDKFRIMGKGSFGCVYAARSKSGAIPGVFCVKAIKKGLIVECKQEKSVVVEKNVMSECASPYVVELAASYQDAHSLYLGMPIIRGGEVAHRLAEAVDEYEEPTGLTPIQAAFYTVGVALGAAHLHSKGFLWRDLKPENVVIGNDGYPRIVDFGLAKRLDLAAGKLAYTMCGTPEYIAPEIVQGTGHGAAADFYALGCFLYECLSGETPFVRDDEYGLSIYRYVVKNPVEPPEGMSTDSIEWQLLCTMLEKDPSRRAGTLKDGIDEIVRHPFIAALVDVDAMRARTIEAPWKPQKPENELDFSHLKPDDEYDDDDSEHDEFDGDSAVFAGF